MKLAHWYMLGFGASTFGIGLGAEKLYNGTADITTDILLGLNVAIAVMALLFYSRIFEKKEEEVRSK